MTGKIINYYAGGNTAKGFYDLMESNLQGMNHIIILQSGPDNAKSKIMKKLADIWGNKGFDLEIIHSASNTEAYDGVIIPQVKWAIIDGSKPYHIQPKAVGAIEQYMNLGSAWNTSLLINHREAILALESQKKEVIQLAYDSFKKGLQIHDDLEDIYIKEMNFSKANELTNELNNKIFIGKHSESKKSEIKHRFFGASTPEGVIDFIPNITDGLSKRFFVKGRAGTGKSTLLKKIATTAEERNFNVEMYHCGFDPDSIDMVIIRELGICLFDSTDPHEYFPNRHGDEIIDLYEKTVSPGTDERYEIEIQSVTKRYKQRMKEGINYLQEAKDLHDQLKNIYLTATDFSVIDDLYEKINTSLEALTE